MNKERMIMGADDIRKIVIQATEETLNNLGFTTDNPHEIQADQIYLRKARQGNDEVAKWAKRSVLGILLSGFCLAAWTGIKQLING